MQLDSYRNEARRSGFFAIFWTPNMIVDVRSRACNLCKHIVFKTTVRNYTIATNLQVSAVSESFPVRKTA